MTHSCNERLEGVVENYRDIYSINNIENNYIWSFLQICCHWLVSMLITSLICIVMIICFDLNVTGINNNIVSFIIIIIFLLSLLMGTCHSLLFLTVILNFICYDSCTFGDDEFYNSHEVIV